MNKLFEHEFFLQKISISGGFFETRNNCMAKNEIPNAYEIGLYYLILKAKAFNGWN
jgi:hypothetical protein